MRAAIEVLRYSNVAGFCLLTVTCLRQWRTQGDASIRWAAAAFGSLAAVSLIGLALPQPGTTGLGVWLVKAVLVVLVLVPYFLYRFAATFQRPTRRLALPARLSTALVVAWSLAIPHFPLPDTPHPWWWSGYRVAIVVQWTVLFSIVAVRLWGSGRHEASVARRRMHSLALAAAGMNGAALLSGVARIPKSPTIVFATQALFLGSSMLFFVSLAPPRWLLRLWRGPDETAMQAAMGALFRAESQTELASVLLPPVVGLVGGRGAAFVSRSGQLLGNHGSTDSERTIVQLAKAPLGAALVGIHRVELRTGTLLIWTSPYAPFFGRDEFALTESLGVFADIVMERCVLADERTEAEHALLHQALHDPLTGLPNRVLFMDRLAHAQTGVQRRGGALSVLFLDLDRFKLVNDTIDHIVGDALLKAVAQRLSDAVRAADTVARFGGDEFVVLAEVSDEHEARTLGERLLAVLATPFSVAAQDLSITASVGVVVTKDHEDPVLLIRNADIAMYRAKEAGRARVEVFDAQVLTASVDRLAVERDLRQAISARSLVLHYQPVIRLADGVLVGVEALVRWQHPTRGLLPPSEFIPVAEESDLIADVGTFALEEACRQARAWRQSIPAAEGLVVWVNVSAAQFSRMDVPRAVASTLMANGLEPHALGLEITESVLEDHADALCDALTGLRTLGVQIAIDDFGTGFSSLGRLKDLPADSIKIDGSFVRGLGHARQDSAIVAACVALADAVGLDTVAECIATADQLDALVAVGCRYGQGFYFSAALPAEKATHYLRQRNLSGELASIGNHAGPAHRSPVALVCDDEASARTLYRCALETAGAEVETMADAIACVEWATEHHPDLALVDLRMPGNDGIWTIRELRRRSPRTRLVLMSADPDLDRFRCALESGADECLSKDAVITRLEDLVASSSYQ